MMINAIEAIRCSREFRDRHHHIREILVSPAQRIYGCRFTPANEWNCPRRCGLERSHDRESKAFRSDQLRHRVQRDAAQQPRRIVPKLVRHPRVRRFVAEMASSSTTM